MRRAFLLVALGWGAFAVLVFVGYSLSEEDVGDAAAILAGGTILLIPLALPLLALRSRWYRLTALVCSLLAGLIYTVLALTGAYFLWPSALLVLLSVLAPDPS